MGYFYHTATATITEWHQFFYFSFAPSVYSSELLLLFS